MPQIRFDSKWLKANVNVKQGDKIKFLDEGNKDEEGNWSFTVGVIDQRTGVVGAQKKFSLNKKNFEAIVKEHGSDNSDDWIGKEMPVYVIKVENPKTGLMVDAIRLYDPNKEPAGDEY